MTNAADTVAMLLYQQLTNYYACVVGLQLPFWMEIVQVPAYLLEVGVRIVVGG